MNKRKDFSVLKRIVFPLNSVVLVGIIAYFNVTVFGLRDGVGEFATFRSSKS